ncbi:MAG: hypothetical protein E6Q24_21330 [Chitinophagaceae bacterium]|jgi:hypothetical protein|nr:MAG: hypothetical protein E6Q24_21330 [Chitinophagaceae bacterium]
MSKTTQGGLLITLCILVLSTPFLFCTHANSSAIYLEQATYDKLAAPCAKEGKDHLIVYYFNGECSICFAKIIQIESELKNKPNTRAVYLAQTIDSALVSYSLKKNNVSACLLVEGTADSSYRKYFQLNEVYEIDEKRRVYPYSVGQNTVQ